MISRLTLQNFIAFESAAFDLSPLSVLTGYNSSGKSSLIHALAVLRQSADEGYLSGSGPYTLLLNGSFVNLGNGRDVLHDLPREIEGKRHLGVGIAVVNNGRNASWFAEYEAESDGLSIKSGEGGIEDAPFLTAPFEYISADRLSPQLTYPKSYRDVTSNGTRLGSKGEHAVNFLRVHFDTSVSGPLVKHPDVESLNLIENVNAWLNSISAGTSIEVRDVPGTDFVSLLFYRQGPQVRTSAQRATNVGFGLGYVLPVIVSCLTASKGSLLIVENPEAHLHPAGQALIGSLCALASEGGAQVVVETHSDHVLNGIRLAARRGALTADNVLFHFFTRETDQLQPKVEAIAIGQSGTVDHWPQGFFDEWDKAVTRLLI